MSFANLLPLSGPLAPYAALVWAALRTAGYTFLSARARIGILHDLSRWLDRSALAAKDLTATCVDAYLAHRQRCGRTAFLSWRSLKPILQPLVDAGVAPLTWPAAPTVVTPFDEILADYRDYLQGERGLSAATTENWLRIGIRCLSGLCKAPCDLTQLGREAVVQWIAKEIRERPGQRTVICSGARSLLRFLFVRQRTALDLSLAVPKLAHWRQVGLPKFLEPEQVQALLNSCDRRTTLGRRDFAILLLLARMGLRRCEVAALEIDDLNWRTGELTVHGKGARRDVLPLPDDVGNALAAHLTRGSGRTDGRAVFLGGCAPFRRLKPCAITAVVHAACRRSQQPKIGSHHLRHSAATMMLRRGASLSEIGQVLRHRVEDTTAIYARVDLRQLREVARPWPGGGQ